MRRQITFLVLFCTGCLFSSSASIISWTDWTSSIQGQYGAASGDINVNGINIDVTYNGNVAWAQTNGGINYWNPSTPYISSEVENAPPGTDIVVLTGGYSNVNTISFSQPVENPVMAIVSMGQPGYTVDYNFDQPFSVLSSGIGYWGSGPFYNIPGTNTLTSQEGHGVVQFYGSVSSISWTAPIYENWHGFSVGTASESTQNVPEPNGLIMVISGIFGLWAIQRKRTKR